MSTINTNSRSQSIKCRFGEDCKKGTSCAFFHTLKFKENAKKREAMSEELKARRVEQKYTRVCSYLDKCTRRDCLFAHSASQLVVKDCNFGDRCINPDCPFFHPDDDVENVFGRLVRSAASPFSKGQTTLWKHPSSTQVSPLQTVLAQDPKFVPDVEKVWEEEAKQEQKMVEILLAQRKQNYNQRVAGQLPWLKTHTTAEVFGSLESLEPPKDTTLNMIIVKKLTGNDHLVSFQTSQREEAKQRLASMDWADYDEND